MYAAPRNFDYRSLPRLTHTRQMTGPGIAKQGRPSMHTIDMEDAERGLTDSAASLT